MCQWLLKLQGFQSLPCDFLLLLDGRFEVVFVSCGAFEFSSVCFDEFLSLISQNPCRLSSLPYPVFDIAASEADTLRRLVRDGAAVCAGCGGLSVTFCRFDLLEPNWGVVSFEVWTGLESVWAGAFRFFEVAEEWRGVSLAIERALAAGAGASVASLAEERVTLDDMRTHSLKV